MGLRLPALALLTLSVFTPMLAQNLDLPMIRGHVIGETILDYLMRVDGGIEHLSLCRTLPYDKSARRSGMDVKECLALISAVDTYTSFATPLNLSYKARITKGDELALFEKGKLVKIILNVDQKGARRIPYEAVMLDLISTFGTPTTAEFNNNQNHRARSTEWNLPDVYVRAQETDPVDGVFTRIIVSILSVSHSSFIQ